MKVETVTSISSWIFLQIIYLFSATFHSLNICVSFNFIANESNIMIIFRLHLILCDWFTEILQEIYQHIICIMTSEQFVSFELWIDAIRFNNGVCVFALHSIKYNLWMNVGEGDGIYSLKNELLELRKTLWCVIFIFFFRFFLFRWFLFSFNFWIVNHENYTLVMKQKKSHFTANKLVRRKMACTYVLCVCVRVCSIYFHQCLFVLQCNKKVDSTNPWMTSIPWHKNSLNGWIIVRACVSFLSIVSFRKKLN